MKYFVLLTFGWIACVAGGCGEDGSEIKDRTGTGAVDPPWDLPSVRAGSGAIRQNANIKLIPASDCMDMVHDAKRNMLYVTTNRGEVQRWNLATQEKVESWMHPLGNLRGMDISPNGDALVVAQLSEAGWRNPKIRHIDLNTGARRDIDVPGFAANPGTYSVAFIDDARVMVSSGDLAQGQLQVVSLDGGQAGAVHLVSSVPLLASDLSRSFLAFATQNDLSGTFGRYSVADDSFRETPVSGPVFEIAVSAAGARYAVSSGDGLRLLDADLSGAFDIDKPGNYPRGVAFGMLTDSFAVSWVEAGNRPLGAIELYDTTSRGLIVRLDDTRRLFSSGTPPFGPGHMRVSRDGRLLFVNVENAIVQFSLAP